jgi:hypothetical protein
LQQTFRLASAKTDENLRIFWVGIDREYCNEYFVSQLLKKNLREIFSFISKILRLGKSKAAIIEQ